MTFGQLKKRMEQLEGYDHLQVVVECADLDEGDGDDYGCLHLKCFTILESYLQPCGEGKGLEKWVKRAALLLSYEGDECECCPK